jgi:tetratricopeptide (TPR) repeat protein
MKKIRLRIFANTILLLAILVCIACEDFVAVDLPDSQLSSPTVFDNKATADAAMAYIYSAMRDEGMLSGNSLGLSAQLGYYADELDFYGSPSDASHSFFTNNLSASNSTASNYWNCAYRQIYAANALYQGVSLSAGIPPADAERLQGEALFVRGLIHLYLTSLYGDVPYVTQTDYNVNRSIEKISSADAMAMAIEDLTKAAELLPSDYATTGRARPNKAVAQGILSRAYLYKGQWDKAIEAASYVIGSGQYQMATIQEAFLNQSTEVLWQLPPSQEGFPTLEAGTFTLFSGPPQQSALSEALLGRFAFGDLRKEYWIASVTDGSQQWHYTAKYRQTATGSTSTEYSILLRLPEILLIRAEAYARQGSTEAALMDLNVVRNRAGLADYVTSDTSVLLEEILNERCRELFCEQGHRFFDLKRYMQLTGVLSPLKPGWNETDHLLPLPLTEIRLNPNLLPQNPGY